VVTGPTGSGKTTTLYSCLKKLNSTQAKLLTIEDPVEYEVEGVMQVPINPAAGLNFARALRTFLRQDPDVVMVGEIRDLETAQIAIQASLTGHLVLTTLHTNDAPSAIARLTDMGIEPFLLASSVEAVLAQRLVRRLCRDCRRSYVPEPPVLRALGADPATMQALAFHRAAGCEFCGHTGYRGRLGLFEFLPINDEFRQSIVRGESLLQLRRQAVAHGMTSLRQAGLAALLAGETSVEEVLKYT
jgi:type IV pilus assembly protein PilB